MKIHIFDRVEKIVEKAKNDDYQHLPFSNNVFKSPIYKGYENSRNVGYGHQYTCSQEIVVLKLYSPA